jgi:hypothetical protein
MQVKKIPAHDAHSPAKFFVSPRFNRLAHSPVVKPGQAGRDRTPRSRPGPGGVKKSPSDAQAGKRERARAMIGTSGDAGANQGLFLNLYKFINQFRNFRSNLVRGATRQWRREGCGWIVNSAKGPPKENQ